MTFATNPALDPIARIATLVPMRESRPQGFRVNAIIVLFVGALLATGTGCRHGRLSASAVPLDHSSLVIVLDGLRPDGSYQILSAEHIFHDYQFSTDNRIALPEPEAA